MASSSVDRRTAAYFSSHFLGRMEDGSTAFTFVPNVRIYYVVACSVTVVKATIFFFKSIMLLWSIQL